MIIACDRPGRTFYGIAEAAVPTGFGQPNPPPFWRQHAEKCRGSVQFVYNRLTAAAEWRIEIIWNNQKKLSFPESPQISVWAL